MPTFSGRLGDAGSEFTPQQITWLERYINLTAGRQVQKALGSIQNTTTAWLLDDSARSQLDTTTILGT